MPQTTLGPSKGQTCVLTSKRDQYLLPPLKTSLHAPPIYLATFTLLSKTTWRMVSQKETTSKNSWLFWMMGIIHTHISSSRTCSFFPLQPSLNLKHGSFIFISRFLLSLPISSVDNFRSADASDTI